MRGPSHNAILPFPINYKGVSYESFRELMRSLNPPSSIKEATISGRLRSRLSNGEVISDELLDECFYNETKDYQKKHGTRVTWLETTEGKRSVEALYAELDAPATPYSVFRTRLKSLQKRTGLVTSTQVAEAGKFSQADWISSYGGGRRKRFVYDGDLYPEHRGEYSAFTAFLKVIGRYEERDLLHSRLKAHWAIDDLLSEPSMQDGAPGYIYKITDRSTGKCYVGLTVNKPEIRFGQHKDIAKKGGGSLLHQAMRAGASTDFTIEILEVVEGGEGRLPEREIDWINTLGTLHPNGLNTRAGGQVGSYDGKSTEWDGRRFQSITSMCRVLSRETGLAEHVIENRFRDGKPLPTMARKRSEHKDAGSPLFRQHLGILKRARARGDSVDPAWQDYDRFKADITSNRGSGRITRIDETNPWGPDNWTWMKHEDIVKRTHGKSIEAFGRTWPTQQEALKEFGIGRGTYNFRIKAGMSIEDALSSPIGVTSKKEFTLDGETWPSRNQACKELAVRYGITPEQAKDRLVRGIPVSRSTEMNSKL